MQPTCPRCNLNPTAMTVQMDENTWQDVCAACGASAPEALVIPLQVPSPAVELAQAETALAEAQAEVQELQVPSV